MRKERALRRGSMVKRMVLTIMSVYFLAHISYGCSNFSAPSDAEIKQRVETSVKGKSYGTTTVVLTSPIVIVERGAAFSRDGVKVYPVKVRYSYRSTYFWPVGQKI